VSGSDFSRVSGWASRQSCPPIVPYIVLTPAARGAASLKGLASDAARAN